MVHLKDSSKNLSIEATFKGRTSECNPLVYERKSYSLILTSENTTIKCKLVRVQQIGNGKAEGGMEGWTEGWVDEGVDDGWIFFIQSMLLVNL